MFKLEEIYKPGVYYSISMHDEEMQVSGFTSDDIYGHLQQIEESGYLLDTNSKPMDGIAFRGFTSYGHDYLDEEHEKAENALNDERVAETTLEQIRQSIEEIRERLSSLESNSEKAEIEADLALITVEVERPEPKRSAFRTFFNRLRDDLLKAGTHEVATQALQSAEKFARHMGWM